MNDELGRVRMETVVIGFEALSRHSHRDAGENIKEAKEGQSASGPSFELGLK